MNIVLLILVALVVLVGLITTIMSVKTWHWAQMLLLLGIFFSSIGTLFLGLEVYRIHRNLRKGIPALEKKVADEEAKQDALRNGSRDTALIGRMFPEGVPYDQEAEGRMPPLSIWTRRLQDFDRQRGPVWRGVKPAGQVNPATGRIAVAIPEPKPSGLDKDAIVYVFEQGDPNAAAPDQGPQYLGEFKVVDAKPDGATLEAVIKLDNRTGNRIARSQGPWELYDTMPVDRHELFAGLGEDDLKKMLPAASVQEYLRQGTKATEDDDEYHRAGFDVDGRRVGPDDAAKDKSKVVEWRYDRPLRDYAYLFSELAAERVVALAQKAGLVEDIAKLKSALEVAKQLEALRTQEKQDLSADLAHIQADRKSIESLKATVETQLSNARKLLAKALELNSQMADELARRQLAMLQSAGGAEAQAPPL